MKKTIKVTAQDIRLGGENVVSNTKCIIALAAKRAGLKNVSSGYSSLSFKIGRKSINVPLPLSARRAQDFFMSDSHARAVKPFQFTITY